MECSVGYGGIVEESCRGAQRWELVLMGGGGVLGRDKESLTSMDSSGAQEMMGD